MTAVLSNSIADMQISQESYNVSCETTVDYTFTRDENLMSCIAQRTRSRTTVMRQDNFTQLLAEISMDKTVEDNYEIVASNAVDSLTLPRYSMDKLRIWYDALMALNTSIDNVTILEESVNQDDITKMFNSKTAEIIKRSNEIQPSQEVADDDLKKEMEEIRDSTFVMERPQYESAMGEVIKTLETLANMNLNLIPGKQMENILRIILAICIDYHIKNQSIQVTMMSMAKYIRELLVLGCKIEVADRNNKKLEADMKMLEQDVENTRAQLVSTNNFLNRQMAGPRSGSEIALEISEMEKKIQTLEEKAVAKEEELRLMWESKKLHKQKAQETQTKLNHIIIDLNAEREKNKNDREKDSRTIKNMMDDNGRYADNVLELNEEVKEKVEQLEKMERKHKIEIDDMTERYEAQDNRYYDMVTSKDMLIMEEREMKKKAASYYGKKMKEEYSKRSIAEKALKDNIESMKALDKKLSNYRQECHVWRNMCTDTWKLDPVTVYDPKNPPPFDEIVTEGEDSGVNESVDTSTADIHGDTSTAGIYGDTEDHMDLTIPRVNPIRPERDPSPLPQREVKRRKVDDHSSSAESLTPDQTREDRRKRSCRTKTSKTAPKQEIQEDVRIQLKDQSKEIESLRKRLDEMNLVVKEKDQELTKKAEKKKTVQEENSETQTEKQICKIAETQTPETGTTSERGGTQGDTSEKGGQPETTSDIGGQQESSEIGANPVVSDTGVPLNPQPNNTAVSNVEGAQSCQRGETQGVVSQEMKGVIMNPDGTFTMTPQFRTWVMNPEMQLIKHHANPKGYPKGYALDKTWHPKPSMLDLDFSYKGEWARMPKDRLDKTGPLYKNFYIVRIEYYINEDGEIKKAICYQKDASLLQIWFDFDDIMQAFPHWVTPTPSYYFNSRRFNTDIKKEYAHLEKSTSSNQGNQNQNQNQNQNKDQNQNPNQQNQEVNKEKQSKTEDRQRYESKTEDRQRYDRFTNERQSERQQDRYNHDRQKDNQHDNHDEYRNHNDRYYDRQNDRSRRTADDSDERGRYRQRRDESSRRPHRDQSRDISKDESSRRSHRDQSRDISRDRYRQRRHSERSSSQESRRRGYKDDEDRKTSYGKGRF